MEGVWEVEQQTLMAVVVDVLQELMGVVLLVLEDSEDHKHPEVMVDLHGYQVEMRGQMEIYLMEVPVVLIHAITLGQVAVAEEVIMAAVAAVVIVFPLVLLEVEVEVEAQV